MLIKSVKWTPEELNIRYGDENNNLAFIRGVCNIVPYHPIKFYDSYGKEIEIENICRAGISHKVVKAVKPKRFDAKGFINAIKNCRFHTTYQVDIYTKDEYMLKNGKNGWTAIWYREKIDEGYKKIYENIFKDDVKAIPFSPLPITRGLRLFEKNEGGIKKLRLILYYLEECRVEKIDLIIP